MGWEKIINFIEKSLLYSLKKAFENTTFKIIQVI